MDSLDCESLDAFEVMLEERSPNGPCPWPCDLGGVEVVFSWVVGFCARYGVSLSGLDWRRAALGILEEQFTLKIANDFSHKALKIYYEW